MDTIISKKFTKKFLLLTVVSVFIVGIFGAAHPLGMPMNDDGTMSGCFLTGMNAICTMSLSEHLTAWQNMFTSLLVKSSLFSLLALAVFLLIFVFAERRACLQKLYFIHQANLFFFNPLRESFAQGILSPKIH